MEIQPLNPEQQSALNDGLSLAAKLLDKNLPLSEANAQELYDALLKTEKEFPEGIIGLGIAFGQLIIETTGMDWSRISDEYGEETCLSFPNKQLICAPISMIQKRIEAKEPVDISDFVKGTTKLLQTRYNEVDYRAR